jgi:tetraacyldisaccharide 4'-kinase
MNKHWYHHRLTLLSCLLLPLSWVYRIVIFIRFACYKLKICRSKRVSVPVIIVGNLSVGGTGKSPMVMWLVQWLRRRGFEPGVVSRGYGSTNNKEPIQVDAHSTPADVGDEPMMLFKRLDCPVVICADRVKAAEYCIANNTCNILISDDGLTHYSLARDLEIVMIDGERRLGNMRCLPAGPLREPASRLQSVDFVVATGGGEGDDCRLMLTPESLEHVGLEENPLHLSAIVGRRVHAVAGIGNPDRFFNTLHEIGAEVVEHPFPDHHVYTAADLQFDDTDIIVMTEKDAVKCASFAPHQCYYLSVTLEPSIFFVDEMIKRIPALR